MDSRYSKGRFKRVVSSSCALALVLTSAIPMQAKTSKVTQIQCASPLSDMGQTVKTTLTLKKGKTFQIKTKSAGKKLQYKSSSKKVAVVSSKGKIKAKKVGKTKITISPKGNKKVKAVITVTVVKSLKKVKKIKLNTKQLSLIKGASGQLKASIASPKKPTTKKMNWFSSNKKIATVSKNGVVTAKGVGTAKITVAAADGQGAKAVCQVSVKEETKQTASATGNVNSSNAPGTSGDPSVSGTPGTSGDPNASGAPGTSDDPNASGTPGTSGDPNASGTPGTSDDPNASGTPSTSPSASPAAELTIAQKDTRTGILQGEEIQLTADGPGSDSVTWTVNNVTGVTISNAGLLKVASDASTKSKITVTATSSADVAVKTATAEFSIVENKSKPLTDTQTLLNEDTEENPLGFTFRSKDATSKVMDPERGEVLRFDSSVEYPGNGVDRLAWIDVSGSEYAGRTVYISGYMKYEAGEDVLTKDGTLNLLIQITRGYTKIVEQYNKAPGVWYYVEGKYKMPSDPSAADTTFYITRSADHLNGNSNVVYYLDDLHFTVEKPTVESVTVSTEDDKETVYQNHTLQFNSQVAGTEGPSQKVDYSIEPEVEGASIDENGLLTVGKVVADTEITVKAVSREDSTKFGTKTVKVLAQTVDSVTVAPDVEKGQAAPTEIYAGQPVQFKADVSVTGDAGKSVIWSVSPNAEGISITDTGVLSVTNAVAGDTKLTVKATSKFDSEKEGTYEITVKENRIESVEISSAGNKRILSSESPLTLSAKVEKIGVFTGEVRWTFESDVAGAKLSSETGVTNSLSVTSDVPAGTEITVCVTSVEDNTKKATLKVTVVEDSREFDINRLNVGKWEDFNAITSKANALTAVQNAGMAEKLGSDSTDIIGMLGTSWKSHLGSKRGVIDDNGQNTNAATFHLATPSDCVQFTITNDADAAKKYQLSFLVTFGSILDESDQKGEGAYELPLVMNLVGSGETTTIKEGINLSSDKCADNFHYRFKEVICEVEVPAASSAVLQLKMKEGAELPTCLLANPDHCEVGASEIHPIKIYIDNVAISSGTTSTLEMKVGEEVSLDLDTIEGDKIQYYTNCSLIKETHEAEPVADTTADPHTCSYTDKIVAEVDGQGKVVAKEEGNTALFAIITHTDGSVERKQCIVRVTD